MALVYIYSYTMTEDFCEIQSKLKVHYMSSNIGP